MKKLLVVVLALGLGLVGCAKGDDGGGWGDGADFGDSGETAGADQTTTGGGDTAEWFDGYVAATAAITTVHVVVDQEVSTAGQNMTTHMEIDMDAKAGALSAHGDMIGMAFTMVVIDGRAYVEVMGVTQEGTLEEMGMSEGDMNPASDIERQRAAVTNVEMVGSERVGGVDTKRYTLTYDVAEMNKILAEKNSDGIVTGDTVTSDVWLDDQMRPVKYESTLTVNSSGVTGAVHQTALYSDYGKPVTVKKP
ncbi:MAG: hypothetical protein FWF02_09835 [Micrococcales bacterium]|nr:hypothetical protein [Micrococcales bacterium]MCL2667988.1 hypothetical protein [Micrococcales bacterium]